MRTSPPALLPIFRNDLQARVLAALLLDPSTELTVPELCDRLGASRAGVYRELQRLVDAGILTKRREGRNTLYRGASGSPLAEPLRTLLERTVGIEPELRGRLAAIDGVEAAAMFGSMAAGRPRADGDVDVLVLGSPDRDALEQALRDVERIAGREVSVSVYDPDDWRARVRAGSAFATTVLSRPLVPLVGEIPGASR